jgi:hypothetical protein
MQDSPWSRYFVHTISNYGGGVGRSGTGLWLVLSFVKNGCASHIYRPSPSLPSSTELSSPTSHLLFHCTDSESFYSTVFRLAAKMK